MCLSRTGKRWISVVVSKWSVFQNTVTYDDLLVHISIGGSCDIVKDHMIQVT